MHDDVEELVIVGAGPAGLATAGVARQLGLAPLLVDRQSTPGGAWARMRPAMRCLSPRRRDRMADGSYPTGDQERATAAEVLAWLQQSADRARFRSRMQTEVTALRRDPGLVLQTSTGPIATRRLVVATGEFDNPWRPTLPGVFAGDADHSSVLDVGACAAGERVVVVGGGNSAAELIGLLLRRGCHITLAARTLPPRPASPPGPLLDALRWRLSGLPVGWLPARGGCRDHVPALDPGLFEALAENRVTRVGAVVALLPEGVQTADGERVACDRLVWATGFVRGTAWLGEHVSRDDRGMPRHRAGLSPEVPGLAFVGLPCQRTRRSGFMRGFADDARAVLKRLK